MVENSSALLSYTYCGFDWAYWGVGVAEVSPHSYTKDYFVVYIHSCGRCGWRWLSKDYIDLVCCTTSSCLDFIFEDSEILTSKNFEH